MDVTASTDSASPSSDWDVASSSLQRVPTRWGSLTWVSARPLIASINHGLAMGARGLVTNLRRHWSPHDPAVIDLSSGEDEGRATENTFFLIGDTGEQDASQYVVAPALSAATRQYRPDFVLIMSDVIYPSGDVNDYPDGLYRPYRSGDPHFQVAAPLLGLPGNHDWYDGLAGFMYHFVGEDMPPDAVYAPAAGQGSPLSRLCRILWRRPSQPDARTRQCRDISRATGHLVQPGPYYAIDTPDLRVVCIDTGIDGTIDERQGAWLRRVSQGEKSKLLVTGKPLVVNEEIHPCPIRADQPGTVAATSGTVWDVVADGAHHYVATVGGDVHNFQQYARRAADTQGPTVHLVAGGGGAFLHATHTLRGGSHELRARAEDATYFGPPTHMFPDRNESLSLFAGLLVPTVQRLVINLSFLLLGAVAAVVVLLNVRSTSAVAGGMVSGAVSVLTLLLAMSAPPRLRGLPRSGRWARLRLRLLLLTIGVLSAATVQLLDPDQLLTYAGFMGGVLTLHAVTSALIRQSGWWRRADEYARNPRSAVFVGGLAALAVVVGAVQFAWGWSTDFAAAAACGLASAFLLLTVGLIGQRLRRSPGRTRPRRGGPARDPRRQDTIRPSVPAPSGGGSARRWHGLAAGYATQTVGVLLGLAQLLIMNGSPWCGAWFHRRHARCGCCGWGGAAPRMGGGAAGSDGGSCSIGLVTAQ